jgi:hypothetical protein
MAGTSRAAFIAALVVFIGGPLLQLIIGGFDQATRFNFWFGLYGWYCAAIVVGYLVHLLTGGARAEEGA